MTSKINDKRPIGVRVGFFAVLFVVVLAVVFFVFRLLLPGIVLDFLNSNINGRCEFASLDVGLSGASVKNLSITDDTGVRALMIPELSVKYDLSKIFSKDPVRCLKRIEVRAPIVDVTRSTDGKINLVSLIKTNKDSKKIETLNLESDVSVSGGKIFLSDYSVPARPLKMELSGVSLRSEYDGAAKASRLAFSAAEKTPSKAEWTLGGLYSLSSPFCDFEGRVSSIDLGAWISMAAPEQKIRQLAGGASASLRCRGRGKGLSDLADSVFLEAVLDVSGASFRVPVAGTDVSSVNASVSASLNGVSVDRLTGFAFGAPFRASLSVSDFKKMALSGSFSLSGLSHDKVLKSPALAAAASSSGVSGGVSSISGTLSGTVSDPVVKVFAKGGGIDAAFSRIDDYSVSSVYRKGAVSVEGLSLSADGFRIDGKGWVFPESKKIMMSFSGDGYPSFLPPGLSASSVDCRFHVFGPLDNPVVAGDVSASGVEASAGGSSFRVGSAGSGFLYSGGAVYLPDLRVSGNGGSLSSSAFYDLKESSLSASLLADSYGVSASGASAVVSGGGTVAGTASAPVASVDLSIDGAFSGKSGSVRVPASANRDFVSFSADGSAMGMGISAAGRASVPDKAVDAVFSLSGIDSASFADSPSLPRLRGSLSGSLIGDINSGFLWGADLSQNSSAGVRAGVGRAGGIVRPSEKSMLSYAMLDSPEIQMPSEGGLSAAKGTLRDASAIITGGLGSLSAFASASFRDGSFAGISLDGVDFSGSVSRKRLAIDSFYAGGKDGSAYISGIADLEKDEAELRADLSEINANSVINKLDLSAWNMDAKEIFANPELSSFQGLAYLYSHLSVKKDSEYLTGRLFLPNGAWRYEKVALFSRLSSNDDRVSLDHFDLSMGPAKFTGEGFAGLRADSPVSISMKAEKAQIERLLALTRYHNLDVKGRFDGDLRISGTMGKPSVEGKIFIANPKIMGQNARSFSAEIKSSGDMLSFDNVLIAMPDGEIRAGGSVAADGRLGFSFASDSLKCRDVVWLREFVDDSGEGDGIVKVEGFVSGTKDKPVADVTFSTTPISVRSQKFDSLEGRVRYDSGRIMIDSLSVRKGEESYSVSGLLELRTPFNPSRRGFITKFFSEVDVKASVKNGSLASFSPVDKAAGGPLCTGRFEGDLEFLMSMSKRRSKIKMDMKARDGNFGGFPFERIDVNLDREDFIMKNINVELVSPGASVGVHGNFDGVDDDDKIVMTSRNFNIAALHPFLKDLPPNLLPYGKCTLDCIIDGTFREPVITSNISIDEAALGAVGLGTLSGTFSTLQENMPVEFKGEVGDDGLVPDEKVAVINASERGNVLKSDLRLAGRGGSMLLDGRLPFSFERFVLRQNGPMELNAKVDYENLDLFGIFMPLSGGTSGRLDADVAFSGVYPDIEMDGVATVKDGKLTPSFLKTPLEGCDAVVNLNGHDVILSGCTGILGGGRFEAQGMIDFEKMALKGMDLSLKGKDLKAVCSELFSGTISCDLDFKMAGDSKTLSGTASVKDALFSVSPMMFMKGEEEETEEDKDDSPMAEFLGKLSDIREGRMGSASDGGGGASGAAKGQEADPYRFDKYVPDVFKMTALAVHLDFLDGVWGSFLSSQVQMKGGLDVSGVPERPDVKGRLSLSKGNVVIPLVAAPFKLNSGGLRFNGDGFVPRVFVKAESTFGEYTSYLTVSGPATNPKIDLEGAAPSVSQANGGHDYSGLYSNSMNSNPALNSMSNEYMSRMAVSSLLEFSVMSPILNALNRSLGLSDISVELDEKGHMIIRLSRAISKNERLFLTYEYSQDINGIYRNLVGMEYKFKRGIKVRVSQDIRGGMYLWVQANRRF